MSLVKQIRHFSGINVKYNNSYFWINQRIGSQIYDFGVKQNLLSERGYIENLEIYKLNQNLILGREYKVGNFKINDNNFDIINPIKNSNLIRKYKINLNKINIDPENIENKIATFEIKNDILRETYFKYFK